MGEHFLDVKEALPRVGGNETLYRKLLGTFMEDERETAVQVEGALRNDDRDTAWKLVHNLKGAAANLGAKPLASAAFELEMAIRAGADTAALLGIRVYSLFEAGKQELGSCKGHLETGLPGSCTACEYFYDELIAVKNRLLQI